MSKAGTLSSLTIPEDPEAGVVTIIYFNAARRRCSRSYSYKVTGPKPGRTRREALGLALKFLSDNPGIDGGKRKGYINALARHLAGETPPEDVEMGVGWLPEGLDYHVISHIRRVLYPNERRALVNVIHYTEKDADPLLAAVADNGGFQYKRVIYSLPEDNKEAL